MKASDYPEIRDLFAPSFLAGLEDLDLWLVLKHLKWNLIVLVQLIELNGLRVKPLPMCYMIVLMLLKLLVKR